jgi:alpha-galactosidase
VEIWEKELHDGNRAIAIFNKNSFDSQIPVDWNALGYNAECRVRDLWRQKDLGDMKKTKSFNIPSHGCMMLKVFRR